jgi:hypothetical protein
VRFFTPLWTGPGPHPASYTMDTASFPGLKWQGHGIDHPPPLSTEVKERVILYFYFRSGPLWSIQNEVNLSLYGVCSMV